MRSGKLPDCGFHSISDKTMYFESGEKPLFFVFIIPKKEIHIYNLGKCTPDWLSGAACIFYKYRRDTYSL